MTDEFTRSERETTPVNRYDKSSPEVCELTQQLLEEQPPTSDDRFICYRLGPEDSFSDVARGVECLVFDEAFGNDAAEMKREYAPYEDASLFFVTVDTKTGMPSGALRIIENTEARLKTIVDLEHSELQLGEQRIKDVHGIATMDTVWDIGTVAVLPEYRSSEGSVSVQLYRAMYVSAVQKGVEHFISLIDDQALQKLTGYLGIPFRPLAGSSPFPYLGSENTQAVYGYVPEFYEKMRRKRFTPKGFLARKALNRLVEGSEDQSLQFNDDTYKN